MILLSGALLGCNRYDLFLVATGRDQVANDADVLFVVDNSDSMFEESVALAENFGRFVEVLGGREEKYGTDGLPDAVERYVDYVQDPGYFVDFQLAITTIDADGTKGALLGDPPILRKGDPDLEYDFVRTLMCEATCFAQREVVESGPPVPSCASIEEWDGQVTRQYLDCLCGVDAWVDNCGGGSEEGLEAVLDTLCRAAEDPPEAACFDPEEQANLLPADAHTADGLLRRGATFIPVVITDEGDISRRIEIADPNPAKYAAIYAEFDQPMSWAVIGPALDEQQEPVCPGTAAAWGILRYDVMVQETGGLKLDVYDEDCEAADFAGNLERVGDLVGGGGSAFRLPRRPVEGSIAVEVGKRGVDRAKQVGRDLFGVTLYEDGWSYRAADRTVLLHGDAVPEPGEEVTIWYWPASERN